MARARSRLKLLFVFKTLAIKLVCWMLIFVDRASRECLVSLIPRWNKARKGKKIVVPSLVTVIVLFRWIPVAYHRHDKPDMKIMSIGFLINEQDTAIIWRGPKKNAMIKQFLSDVDWGELDYLVIDTPPGTSDEHISVVECLPNSDGALLVTTPQAVSTGDVRREITFCKKGNIPILGIVENMSGYVCEHCSVSC